MTTPSIIYIDDDYIDRNILNRYAKNLAVNFLAVESFAKFKILFNDQHAGVIIDWNICDADGVDVAEYARRINPSIAIVFVSGIFSDEQLSAAEIYAPLACLEKSSDVVFAKVVMEKILTTR